MIDFDRIVLAYHYHVAVAVEGKNIFIPYWVDFGKWIDALASGFKEVVLISQTTNLVGENPYLVRSKNVSICNLGPVSPKFTEQIRHVSLYRKIVAQHSYRWDVVGFEVPSLLATYLFPIMSGKKVFFWLIGNMPGVLRNAGLPIWKKFPLLVYWTWDKWRLSHQANQAIVFAGGPHYKQEYPLIRRLNVIHTSTISESDIKPREDCCNGSRLELVCISRISPEKGIDLLIRVAAILCSRGVNFRLRIAGAKDGCEYEKISADVHNRRLENFVEFSGFVPHGASQHELLDSSDIFLIPHPRGLLGQPRTTWEAMARGLPVVATDGVYHPSLPHKEAIFYVNPDSPEQMVDAILEIRDNPGLRQRLIKAGPMIARERTIGCSVDLLLSGLRAHWDRESLTNRGS